MLRKARSNQHISSDKIAVAETRPQTSADSKNPFWKNRTHLDNVKRDSGLAPSVASSGQESTTDGGTDVKTSLQPPRQEMSIPSIALNGCAGGALEGQDVHLQSAPGSSRTSQEPEKVEEGHETSMATPVVAGPYISINTRIETGGFDNPFGADQLTFSKRGSVMINGQKPLFDGSKFGSVMSERSPALSSNSPYLGVPQRSPSTAEKTLSQKVRLMYEGGAIPEETDVVAENEGINRPNHQCHVKGQSTEEGNDTVSELARIVSPGQRDSSLTGRQIHPRPASVRSSYVKMEPWEAAGGVEDYHDVSIRDVDRYGFIRPRTAPSRGKSTASIASADDHEINGTTHKQRPSSEHGSVRNGKLYKPPPDSSRTNRLSAAGYSTHSSRPTSRANRHTPSALSFLSHHSKTSSNKHREFANEASTMLSVQPGLPQNAQGPDSAETMKHKTEQRRVEKWEKMARRVKDSQNAAKSAVGGGQVYTFDTHSSKLVERVWKGIPDVWRAPAWHSFLTAPSNLSKQGDYVSDDELTRRFFAHQEQDSPDDGQIDMDVPRTIGQHVMFRARYRGGQRLLFRVLRALSLEYPETGYAQGMAPLAATLLCYFDEEQAFVCACRLWRDRGLAELFGLGFGLLKSTLTDFETNWLAENHAVKKQLDEYGIDAMSYGTKWYLTLFNYALPFEAQLRVWDVFILLSGSAKYTTSGQQEQDDDRFDVLHAIAAAIFDGLQETLVDAEFENAMGALTGNVPVANADVLMRVAKAEYEDRQRRRRRGK